ncbi:hypothetical protein GWN42_32910 [candidate division KSB1 bacterium]|nr:hypothetical protein [candidate division KSB1 bacterium]
MNSTLTLLGSIIIGGIFMLGLMAFYGDVTDFSQEGRRHLLAQESTASLMEIIMHDFQKIGSGVPSPALAIIDTSEISFLGDIDGDGAVDTVRYYTSSPSAASATPNPNDVILYREINGVETLGSPAGITDFTITILDAASATTELMNVQQLVVSMTVQSLFPYDGDYGTALWEEKITPVNLIRGHQ